MKELCLFDDKGQTSELWERLVKECPSALRLAGLMPEKPTGKQPLPPGTDEGDEEAEGAQPSISPEEYDKLLAIKKKIDAKDTYIGSSVPILRIFEQIEVFNKRPAEPVLILGATGTGKSELVELIHCASDRREASFQREQASDNKHSDMSIDSSRRKCRLGRRSRVSSVSLL